MIRRTLVATALGATLATATPALAAEERLARTISLSGHGEVRVVPDMAMVSSGVVTAAPTAAQALSANTEVMNKLFAALKDAGIAPRDIQTSNFSVQPRYDYGNNSAPPVLTGYEVNNTVTVTLRKLEGLGALLDRLVSSGSNQITGVSFQVSKPGEALDRARQLAAEDAAHKAKVYAKAMDLSLGPVLAITDVLNSAQPVPMQYKAAAAEAMAVPVAAGEQVITADVNVIWEIR